MKLLLTIVTCIMIISAAVTVSKYNAHRQHEADIKFTSSLNPIYPNFTAQLQQYYDEQKDHAKHNKSMASITWDFNRTIFGKNQFDGGSDVDRMIEMLTSNQYTGAQGLFNRTIVPTDK